MRETNWIRWNPFKQFARERDEVVGILESVLAGTMDCRAWDDFIRIPMKGSPELDCVRVACEALAAEEKIEESGMMSHSASAREKLRTLLSQLKNDFSKT